MSSNPIIVALDVDEVDQARRLVDELCDHVGYFKIGLEFIMSQMAKLMADEQLWRIRHNMLRYLFQETQGRLMWDGKFDDIPNTVGGAVRGLKPVSPWGLTIQASCGQDGIKAAVENKGKSLILGVTVLTSLSEELCRHIFGLLPTQAVVKFATDLREYGADGIVCSPQELVALDVAEIQGLVRVVPGVRSAWADSGDQKRQMTPRDAYRFGADYVVLGRPLTRPPEGMTPADAAKRVLAEIYG